MARRRGGESTRLHIVQAGTKMFLERGYTHTSVRAIADELGIGSGNVTFYFHSKEHLLAELVDLLCKFQWKRMEEEADEGYSSVMAICLELTSMVSAAESDEMIKDFFLSAYSSPLCLEIIRRNDAARAKDVFREYRPDWTDENFAEAEILCSGIEYATLMTANDPVRLENRIAGALHGILGIYGVPEEVRCSKIERVLTMDYKGLSKQILMEFHDYVQEANEHALHDLLQR